MKYSGENGVAAYGVLMYVNIVFQVAAVLLLPIVFEVDGIWYSLIVAEIAAAAMTIFFWIIKRKKYGY